MNIAKYQRWPYVWMMANFCATQLFLLWEFQATSLQAQEYNPCSCCCGHLSRQFTSNPPSPREDGWVLPTAFWHYSLVTALEITTVFTILHGSAFHRPSFQQMSPNLPPSAQIAGIASVNAARRKKDQ